MTVEAASLSRPRLLARGDLPGASAPPTKARAARRNGANPGAAAERAARARTTRVNLLAGVVVLLAMLLQVWTGLSVGTLGYELSRAHDLTQRLDRQLNELTLENSGMMKPDLLAEEARRRLGLDWPQSGQIVDLP